MSRYRIFRNLLHTGSVLDSISARCTTRLCLEKRPRLELLCQRAVHLQGGDTIFALSSGHGKCGVAVIRVSGPQAKESIHQMCSFQRFPAPRSTQLRRIRDTDTKESIDRGLVIWFPSPESFTGEDCVEFQVHGGPAVIAAMVTSLGKLPSYRHAEPGEFTKRAFMNGKLDLTEVEGLGDLIHAETEVQRKQALRQMEGDLGKLYTDWRNRAMKAVANVEAFIDFSESDTLEEDLLCEVTAEVDRLRTEITTHLSDHRRGERLREGVHVVIVGRPNVGKSSLLNSLCQRPAAIVSPIPGTTRDIVETALNVGGYPVLLSDTAGLRETEDFIEKEGVYRALQRARQADIKVLVIEATEFVHLLQTDSIDDIMIHHLMDIGLVSRLQQNTVSPVNIQTVTKEGDLQNNANFISNVGELIVVLNKCDLISDEDLAFIEEIVQNSKHLSVCHLSCTSGHGMEEFLNVLQQRLAHVCGNPLAGIPSLTQARYRFHLEKCQGHLENYKNYMELGDVVLAAQSLRKVLFDIGKITGRITTEDILDIIFKDFCIGK